MYPDHEFDPITPEEEAQRAQEAEFARRVRREVLRIERGEAEEEIRADLEREAEEKAEAEERERRERRRKASTFWQLFSRTVDPPAGAALQPYDPLGHRRAAARTRHRPQ